MTIDAIRAFCRTLAGTTEDIKWGNDLVFSVGGRMYAVICLEPPHTIAFKCSPDDFHELVERDGIIPAPYLARAMWVQDQELGGALNSRELERLVQRSHELVRAKLPRRLAGGGAKPARAVSKPSSRAHAPTAARSSARTNTTDRPKSANRAQPAADGKRSRGRRPR
jgi:predicted DNA-binding protein (MmcQ/YjbR family)